jgi:hypothetical protein
LAALNLNKPTPPFGNALEPRRLQQTYETWTVTINCTGDRNRRDTSVTIRVEVPHTPQSRLALGGCATSRMAEADAPTFNYS